MKIHRLETHDRLEHLKKDQSASIQQGAEDCLKRNPLSLAYQQRSPYVYLFAHPRTNEDGVTKTMFWQPRLTKPQAQSNSYLLRAISNTDLIEVCWLLPAPETWGQHKKGNVTESDIVQWSIQQYLHNKEELEKPDPEDFTDERDKLILLDIAKEMEEEIRIKKLYAMPTSSEAYLGDLA